MWKITSDELVYTNMFELDFVGTPHLEIDYGLPLGSDLDKYAPPGWNTKLGSNPMMWIEYINSGGLDLRWADLQGVNLLDFDLRDAKLDFAILHNHPSSSVSGYAPPMSHDSSTHSPIVSSDEVSPRLPEKQLRIWKIVNGFYFKPDPEIDKNDDPRYWWESHYFQCEYDLRGYDLSNAIFSLTNERLAVDEHYYPHARMQKANLEGANLSRSYFTSAKLNQANLKDANLSWADLQGCIFHSGADLRRADLSHSKLAHANFVGSDLRYANLSWADGLGYPHSEAENPHGLLLTKMTGAHLYGQRGDLIRKMGVIIDEKAYVEMLEDEETYGVEIYNPNSFGFGHYDPDWEGLLNVEWEVDGTYTECFSKRGEKKWWEFWKAETVGLYLKHKANGAIVGQSILDWEPGPRGTVAPEEVVKEPDERRRR